MPACPAHSISRSRIFLSSVLVGAACAAWTANAETPSASPADPKSLIADLGLREAGSPVRERPGWKAPRLIVVSPQLHEQLPELQKLAPQVKFIEISGNTPAKDIANADASLGVCSLDVLSKAPKLQWIQWLAAGVERCIQQPIVKERRPLVTNMQRAAGAGMAEHVLAMMLILSRHFDYFLDEQRQSRWSDDAHEMPPAQDLEGKTVLIVGLGGIGTEVAKRAHAFGMTVTATRASGRTGPDYVSYVGLPDELPKLAKDADFIVNCAPLTPATTGIFNAQFFAGLKPTAYFVSVGRGQSTVTADLIAALSAKKIAGAGLDVTDPEPLPPESPLWRMPNVIITPHISGTSPLSATMRSAIVRENLRRYLAGEPMLSVVDIDKGY